MPGDPDEIVRRFHSLFYESARTTWNRSRWLGVPAFKCPLDLWVYQEILFQTRPDLVVETGTASGGSAYFFASVCDQIGSGRVITIDVNRREDFPAHARITYLTGSSTAPEIVTAVAEAIGPEERVMVILDSDHAKDHVLEELRSYAPLVTRGNYLVVEDTNLNGNPVFPEHGPGPREAVEEFMSEDDGFVVDSSREKFLLTFNPGGFLKRVKGVAAVKRSHSAP